MPILPSLQRSQTRPQSPEHHASSALSSEKPDRTTVPRAPCQFRPLFKETRQDHSPQSTMPVLPSLQRSQFCPLLREARQDHSPQSTMPVLPSLQRSQIGPQSQEHHASSALSSEKPDRTTVHIEHHANSALSSEKPDRTTVHIEHHASSTLSSEKPDRTTVPRAPCQFCPSLQRSQTGPQSPEHHASSAPIFREARFRTTVSSEHHASSGPQSLQSTMPILPLSSEKPDRTTVLRAPCQFCPYLQRSQTGPQSPEHHASSALSSAAVAPWSNATRTAVDNTEDL